MNDKQCRVKIFDTSSSKKGKKGRRKYRKAQCGFDGVGGFLRIMAAVIVFFIAIVQKGCQSLFSSLLKSSQENNPDMFKRGRRDSAKYFGNGEKNKAGKRVGDKTRKMGQSIDERTRRKRNPPLKRRVFMHKSPHSPTQREQKKPRHENWLRKGPGDRQKRRAKWMAALRDVV